MVLNQRVTTLRRATTKRQTANDIARDNLSMYIANGYNGTNIQQVTDGITLPAPMPGSKSRAEWKPLHKPYGPIGILLCQLHEKGTGLSHDFNLHAYGWPVIPLFDCPLCELLPTTTRIATTARTQANTNNRKTATHLHDIDHRATNSSAKIMEKGDLGLLKMVQQGAAWDTHIAVRTGFVTEHTCPLCGSEDADITHIIWWCPCLAEKRRTVTAELGIDFELAPQSLAAWNCTRISRHAGPHLLG